MRQPRTKTNKTKRGFSLMEAVMVMAISVLMVGVAVSTFARGTNMSTLVSERAQMQQDLRAAEDMMIRDFSMAGAGLPTGGIGLTTGGGPVPKYGCDQTATCYVPFVGAGTANGITFPGRALTYVIPGPALGPQLNGAQPKSDVITVAYEDTTFPLDSYGVTFNANATKVTFTTPAPAPVPPLPDVTDVNVGLAIGDLLLFQNGAGSMAIGEVTGTNKTSVTTFDVNFGAGDILNLNQPGTQGDLDDFIGVASPVQAHRIYVITYYLSTWTNNNGVAIPRLMRQVNGQPAVPIAENVVDFRVSYDTYDNSGNLLVNVKDGGASLGVSPNMIRKINIQHLTARKTLGGGLGNVSVDLQTEISARNMSFKDRYQ